MLHCAANYFTIVSTLGLFLCITCIVSGYEVLIALFKSNLMQFMVGIKKLQFCDCITIV